MTSPDWPDSIQHPHYSGLSLHRRCAQAWAYSEVHRLETDHPERRAVRRELGSWWHAVRAVDACRRAVALDSLRWAPPTIEIGSTGLVLSSTIHRGRSAEPLTGGWHVDGMGSEGRDVLTAEDVIDLARDWWDSLPVEVEHEWIEEVGEALPDGLARMNDLWRWRWADSLTYEVPVAVEVQWERPLFGSPKEWDGAIPEPVMQGTADEVYIDLRRNLLVVRDHKTHKTLNQSAVDDLMDSQLQIYGWGLTEWVEEWGLGDYSLAVAYDRVRTTPPKEPVVTKSGTLSKSTTDYDLLTYQAWAAAGPEYPGTKKDGSGAGTYKAEEAVVDRLRAPAALDGWTRRTLTPLNLNTVRSHLRAARTTWHQTVETTRLVRRDGEAPRSLSRYTCGSCDFADLCRAEMAGGPGGEYDPGLYGLRPKRD